MVVIDRFKKMVYKRKKTQRRGRVEMREYNEQRKVKMRC